MADFTVGQVAGAINIGLLFLQITLPLLQVLVLVGILQSKSTAITWSVVSRFIQSTLWPSILSCDAAAGRREGVMTRVIFMGWLGLISTLLLAVAGILTPIGLGEASVLSGKTKATFAYARDRSVFGQTAPSRAQYSNSRTCNFGNSPCPGVNDNDTVSILAGISEEGRIPVAIYQNYIPENITDYFSSGSKGSLISSPFEIQFRQFETSSNEKNLTARLNTTGTFFWTEHVMLTNDIICRDGLVVDTVNGGVGLRNHSVPIFTSEVLGTTWTEDLLWLEPDTVCVDTNWSISTEFQLAPFSKGGLSLGLNTWLLRDGPGHDPGRDPKFSAFKDTISSPDLLGRAQLAAEVFDYHLSWLLNLGASNLSIGAYNVTSDAALTLAMLDAFGSHATGLVFGHLEEPYWFSNPNDFTTEGIIMLDPARFNLSSFNVTLLFETELVNAYPVSDAVVRSPWSANQNTTAFTWDFGLEACKLLNGHEIYKPGLANVDCGYLITPPRPSKNYTQDSNEEWTMSINVCATSL